MQLSTQVLRVLQDDSQGDRYLAKVAHVAAQHASPASQSAAVQAGAAERTALQSLPQCASANVEIDAHMISSALPRSSQGAAGGAENAPHKPAADSPTQQWRRTAEQEEEALRRFRKTGVVLRIPDSDDSIGQHAARNKLFIGSETSPAAANSAPPSPEQGGCVDGRVCAPEDAAALHAPANVESAAGLAMHAAPRATAPGAAAAQPGTPAALLGIGAHGSAPIAARVPAWLQSGRGEDLDEFLQPTQAWEPRPHVTSAPARDSPTVVAASALAARTAASPAVTRAVRPESAPTVSGAASLQPTDVQLQSDDEMCADDGTSAHPSGAAHRQAGTCADTRSGAGAAATDAPAGVDALLRSTSGITQPSSAAATQANASLVVPDSPHGSHGCSASLLFSDGSFGAFALDELPATQVLTATQPDNVDAGCCGASDGQMEPAHASAPVLVCNQGPRDTVEGGTGTEHAELPCAAAHVACDSHLCSSDRVDADTRRALPAADPPFSQVTVRESASPPDHCAVHAPDAPAGAQGVACEAACAAWAGYRARDDSCLGTVVESQFDSDLAGATTAAMDGAAVARAGGNEPALVSAVCVQQPHPPSSTELGAAERKLPDGEQVGMAGIRVGVVLDTEESLPATQSQRDDAAPPAAGADTHAADTAPCGVAGAAPSAPQHRPKNPATADAAAVAAAAEQCQQAAHSDAPAGTVRDSDSDDEGATGASRPRKQRSAKPSGAPTAGPLAEDGVMLERRGPALPNAPNHRAASAWTVQETVTQGGNKRRAGDASQRVRWPSKFRLERKVTRAVACSSRHQAVHVSNRQRLSRIGCLKLCLGI